VQLLALKPPKLIPVGSVRLTPVITTLVPTGALQALNQAYKTEVCTIRRIEIHQSCESV
jgi:hypothetical protein